MLFNFGLSDLQMDMLDSGDPASWREIVEVVPDLTAADLASVPMLRYADAVLSSVYDEEPVELTTKGYLPRAMVKALMAGAFADAESLTTRVNREADSVMLSWTRRLCQFGGATVGSKGRAPSYKSRSCCGGNIELFRDLSVAA